MALQTLPRSLIIPSKQIGDQVFAFCNLESLELRDPVKQVTISVMSLPKPIKFLFLLYVVSERFHVLDNLQLTAVCLLHCTISSQFYSYL